MSRLKELTVEKLVLIHEYNINQYKAKIKSLEVDIQILEGKITLEKAYISDIKELAGGEQ